MERITELMTSQNTISNLNQQLNQLSATENELSTGLSINEPSDNPYGASLAIQLNGQLSALTSYTGNVSDGTAWTSQADSSLMDINEQVQSVQELVVQAANGTSTPAQLDADATEVNQLIAGIKQDASAQYDGQYIFSGTDTTTAPYQAGSNDAYQGNSGAIQRSIGPGAAPVQVNTDISQLLGNGQTVSGQPAGDGLLLNTLRNIAGDMQAGSTASLGNDLTDLQTNMGTLGQMQANVGAVQDQLQMASSRIQNLQTEVQTQLSSTEDVNMAQTMTQYSTEQASYNAALQASASVLQTDSLANFLSS
jgi:flagellar hook-associated protein 3 FlgL